MSSINHRLKIYVRATLFYTTSMMLFFLILYGMVEYSKNPGLIEKIIGMTCLLGLLATFFMYHVKLSDVLFPNTNYKINPHLVIVLILSGSLISFKILINEEIFPLGNCGFMKGPSESERLWNYFVYSIWTTIILWEVYYNVIRKFIFKKTFH